MKYAFGLIALLAVGCGTSTDPVDTPAPSGVDLTALDRSANPCTDFYQFACGTWINNNPVGPDGSLQTKYFEPYYATLPPLRKIIEDDAAGAREADDPFAALIGKYHTSCLAAPFDTSGRAALGALLAKVDAVTTLDDLARRIAAHREIGSGAFFRFYVGVDLGDATRHTTGIFQGGVELSSPSYYLDPANADVLADYRNHITALSNLVGGTPIDADAVIKIETALATAYVPADQLRDPETLYHPMKVAEVTALAPTFPWQVFWTEAGFPALTSVNVATPTFVAALEAIFAKTPLADLKSYLRWQLLQDRSDSLDQAFLDEDFRFFSRFTGQASQHERWFTCFNATLATFGEAVALPYLARSYDETATTFARGMFEGSRDAFAKRLGSAAWLDAKTRSEALAKLDAMVAKVGHPDKAPDFTGLDIDAGSYLGNALRIRQFRSARSRASLDQPVDRSTWNLSPLTVNATYSPTVNDVTLPAALLASPFFETRWSNAANYGALGAVLGHEMTHGFDDQGRHFDANGTLRNWWTPAVAASFAERSQCVVDQFDAFEPMPGEHVNGTLTLGENLADLGGVNIAFDALFNGNDSEAGGDGFTAEQVFFLAYAQTKCENVRPDLASQWLLNEPHAPGKLRINGPLSNLPAFREAFSCSATSPMVRATPCDVW
ncbi:MAG: M13 family metallopeptidase [Byssovorax sp.]